MSTLATKYSFNYLNFVPNRSQERRYDEMLPRVYGQHLGRFEGEIEIEYDEFSRSARTAYNQLLDAFDAQTKRKEVNKYNEFLNKISDKYPHLLTGVMGMRDFCRMFVFSIGLVYNLLLNSKNIYSNLNLISK